MQLSFRLDKRPGESHLALDGKKRQANRELLATNSKKDRSWLQTRSQNLISKMKPFLASPDLPEIETKKKWLPSKETQTVQTERKCRGATPIPVNVPNNPSTDAVER